MSSLNDESLLLEFVAESRDHLASIEPDLLALERDGRQSEPEIINRVFRAIHSIKGASGFFGLDALKNLSHSMENMLMLMRDGKLFPEPHLMDPLLEGVDRLSMMLDDVNASEQVEYKDLVDRLEGLMASGGAPVHETVAVQPKGEATPQQAQSVSIFQPDRTMVDSAIKNGQTLYSIRMMMDSDLSDKGRTPLDVLDQLVTTGLILDTTLDMSGVNGLADALDSPLPLMFLYATVLEPELLAAFVDVNVAQLTVLKPVDILGEEEAAAPTPESATAPSEAPPTTPAKLNEAPKAPIAKAPQKAGAAASDTNDTVRVKVSLLNRLMDLAGELVLARNQLMRTYDGPSAANTGVGNILQNVDMVTSDLQEHIMQTRMQPISSVFGKFPRVVRDLSRMLNKEIEIQMSGEEVELDKSILESLSDPLTHLIRNCCDHAIEKPDVREAAGKARYGTIFLKAYQESGHINIAITDDGSGIDHERIVKKILENNLMTESAIRQMSVQEQVNLIFMPGLSTADKITEVSGRGVGMDVVKTNIEQIGGHISIETEKGTGTTILLRLPLTLAIIPSLVVGVSDQTFAVPQINLVELVCVKASQVASRIEKVGSAPVLRLRNKLLPLVKLVDVLGLDAQFYDEDEDAFKPDHRRNIADRRQESGSVRESVSADRRLPSKERRVSHKSDYNIMVLKSGANQYGLIVDEIKDIEEIVVKPLSSFTKGSRCFSGATIMGDGRVAMILDVGGIVAISGLSFAEVKAEQERRAEELVAAAANRTEKQAIILFNLSEREIFAIPLAAVQRLEKFKTADVESVGSRNFLAYQGKSLSLLYLDEHLPVKPLPHDIEEAYLIIPADGDGKTGIVASQIIDTIDTSVCLEPSFVQHPGVSGSAVINNRVTLFIEPTGLLQSHLGDQAWQQGPLQLSY